MEEKHNKTSCSTNLALPTERLQSALQRTSYIMLRMVKFTITLCYYVSITVLTWLKGVSPVSYLLYQLL